MAVGVWLFGLGRSVWRSVWCSVVGAASMPRRCVPVSRWGRNSTRRWRTYQQREQKQQQRTAGGKVSPRKTLPPESVTGAAQHKTPGAPPRVPAGARAPAARPLVVKVDDADAAESPRHAQNVPRLHLQHARRRVPLSCCLGWAARRDGRAATFEPATSTHRSSGYSKMVCCTGVCGLAGCRAANLSTGGRGAGECRVCLARSVR